MASGITRPARGRLAKVCAESEQVRAAIDPAGAAEAFRVIWKTMTRGPNDPDLQAAIDKVEDFFSLGS